LKTEWELLANAGNSRERRQHGTRDNIDKNIPYLRYTAVASGYQVQ